MDTVAIGIIALALVGIGWLVFFKSDDDDTPSTPTTPAPVPTTKPTPTESKKVQAPKLPTAKTMEGMTKAKLEELGREHGVELDKRKTKANMIADLKTGTKLK